MDTINLAKISDDLFKLVFKLNKKSFNQDEIVKGFSMPPSHVKVIFYLAHIGSSAISQIGQNLCISKSNMTPIIDKLMAEDLVNRYEDPNDRRILRIELTPKAHELFIAEKKKIRDKLLSKISILSDEDLNELSESISTLSRIIEKLN